MAQISGPNWFLGRIQTAMTPSLFQQENIVFSDFQSHHTAHSFKAKALLIHVILNNSLITAEKDQ